MNSKKKKKTDQPQQLNLFPIPKPQHYDRDYDVNPRKSYGKKSEKNYASQQSGSEPELTDETKKTGSIDDFFEESPKEQRINEFLRVAKPLYVENIYEIKNNEEVSLTQANMLAKYFPGKFNTKTPLKKSKIKKEREYSDMKSEGQETVKLRKTIFEIRNESYWNVHVAFNNVYKTYLNKK